MLLKLSAQNEQLLQPASQGRIEHEVIDDELALAGEKIAQAFLAVRTGEHIVLLEPAPRATHGAPGSRRRARE
jgi:hypothetical protein